MDIKEPENLHRICKSARIFDLNLFKKCIFLKKGKKPPKNIKIKIAISKKV